MPTQSPQKVDTVIFDFDGVIADSGEIFAEALAEVLGRAEPLSKEEVKILRSSKSVQEVMKILSLKKWQLPSMTIKGKRSIAKKMHRVEVFDSMPETIKDLDKQGCKIYILSTNSEEAIRQTLARYQLDDYILKIYSGTRLLGKAKRLKTLMRKENLSTKQCVYVGDETRDIEAARQAGIKSIAVEWGYNLPEALKSLKPDAMVSTPQDLKRVIKSLSE